MRRRTNITEAIGTDAFLDIVANLVGILLILIMVIGVRMDDASQNVQNKTAKKVTKVSKQTPSAARQQLPPVIIPNSDEARLELTRLQSSIRDADREKTELARLTLLQKLDRDNLMLAVTRANHVLEQRHVALDESQRQQLATDLRVKQSQEEYQSVIEQLEVAKLTEENQQPEVLQHVATPLAKTVFVREEHFRLKNGRLLYVPLNEMTNQLRREAPKKIWKLDRARQTTETIGPREGFQLRYTLRRNRIPFRTESGMSAVREVVELDRFVMVPLGNASGETVEEVFEETSTFRSRLSGWSSRDTIITVWVYPDSFKEFRELKSGLYEMGFLTAARPIPKNQLISGSPNGTRSAAQ